MAAPLTGRVASTGPCTKFCARLLFTLVGLKPLSLRRPSPLASRRQSMYNRTDPSTASTTTTKPLWRRSRTWTAAPETHIIVNFPLAGAGRALPCTPTYAPCQAKQSGRDPRLAPGTGLQRDRSQSLPACEEASATNAPPQHHRRAGTASSARIHTPVSVPFHKLAISWGSLRGRTARRQREARWVQHGQLV
jgi:hypothetical protein